MLQKSNSSSAGVKTMYKKVSKAVEELIGSLGNTETKVIRIALADHHHVNRSFDLLGLSYPNWPQVDLKEAEGGKKRKRAEASDKLTSTSVVELPNLMPPRSACLPLDTKHSRENTKLRSPVGHTPRENPKIHIFHQDHK